MIIEQVAIDETPTEYYGLRQGENNTSKYNNAADGACLLRNPEGGWDPW